MSQKKATIDTTENFPLGFKLRHTLENVQEGEIKRVAWSPDGRMLAFSSTDHRIRLWDMKNNEICQIMEGHSDTVYGMAWSPNGLMLASGSRDHTVCLWNTETGKIESTLSGHWAWVMDVAWSPDGRTLASCADDGTIRFWDVENRTLLQTIEHPGLIQSLAWSPDGYALASASSDCVIRIWEPDTWNIRHKLDGHIHGANSVAWLSDNHILASGAGDGTIRFWSVDTVRMTGIIEGHTGNVMGVSISADAHFLASKSRDHTVRLWDCESFDVVATLKEPHSSSSTSCLAFHPIAPILATLGEKGTIIRIWDLDSDLLKPTPQGLVKLMNNGLASPLEAVQGGRIYDTWKLEIDEIMKLYAGAKHKGLVKTGSQAMESWDNALKMGETGRYEFTDGTDQYIFQRRADGSMKRQVIHNISGISLQSNISFVSHLSVHHASTHYINAKVVLLGDSGVGKSGLGIRIAEKEFRETRSTHGAQFWQIPVPENMVQIEGPSKIQAELTLWDLAGQPEYRLVHQLFLDDLDAALLLFDCSDPAAPFRGVYYWAKVLKKHAPSHALKFLVSARCDVSPVTVTQNEIRQISADYDYSCSTSAFTGEGVEKLLQKLLKKIPWDELPRTSTPRLFQTIRKFLLARKADGDTFIPVNKIKIGEAKATQAEIDMAVSLLQCRGLVHRLESAREPARVLLKPELINQYASSVIQAARNDPRRIGTVLERDVLIANLPLTGFERLEAGEEKLILESTGELLIGHDLGQSHQNTSNNNKLTKHRQNKWHI